MTLSGVYEINIGAGCKTGKGGGRGGGGGGGGGGQPVRSRVLTQLVRYKNHIFNIRYKNTL